VPWGERRLRAMLRVIPFGLAYIVIGIVTADVAAFQGRPGRLMGWGASLLVYVVQLLVERLRFDHTTLRSALHASGAVAIAAFVLALVGPVRAHWGAVDQPRALMALILWPVLAGLPSFVLGLGAAAMIGRVFGHRRSPVV
jgi:hypothetical protein